MKTEFLKEAKERLKSMHTPTPKPLLLKSKNELRALKKSLVLVPADKAANNIIFVCKRLYTHIIRKELTKADGAYRPETRTKQEILDEHKEFLNKWKLGQVNELPTQYALPKMHKMPKITCRSIAASSKCSVKAPSQLLGKMLTCISDTIRNLNDDILIKTGVRRYFVIKDGYEVSDFLAGWRRHKNTHTPRTFDFLTLYTALPLDDLFERISRVINEARDAQGDAKFSWMLQVNPQSKGNTGAKWIDSKRSSHRKSEHIFSIDELLDLLRFVIDNSFVVNGGKIIKQIGGIPMGTNSAPVLANLYLYSYESEYMEKLTETDLNTARRFHLTFRLIDDVLSLDNPQSEAFRTPKEQGGIYPAFLSCNETSTNTAHVNFCGIRIDCQEYKFITGIYDKKDDFSFEVRNYPHIHSNIPEAVVYSAFTGQMHRFYRICNTHHLFNKHMSNLALSLIKRNGCSARKLCHAFFEICQQAAL